VHHQACKSLDGDASCRHTKRGSHSVGCSTCCLAFRALGCVTPCRSLRSGAPADAVVVCIALHEMVPRSHTQQALTHGHAARHTAGTHITPLAAAAAAVQPHIHMVILSHSLLELVCVSHVRLRLAQVLDQRGCRQGPVQVAPGQHCCVWVVMGAHIVLHRRHLALKRSEEKWHE